MTLVKPPSRDLSPVRIGELLKTSLRLYRQNILKIIAVYGLFLILQFAYSALSFHNSSRLESGPKASQALMSMVTSYFYIMLIIGLLWFTLCMYRGEKAGIGSIFKPFVHWIKIPVTLFICCIMLMLGTICLIVPGIIIGLSLYQLPFLFIERPDKGPIGLIKESFRLSKGFRMELFGMLMIFGIIGFLLQLPQLIYCFSHLAMIETMAYSISLPQIIPMLLSGLILMPIQFLALAGFYQEISSRDIPEPPVEAPQPAPNPLPDPTPSV